MVPVNYLAVVMSTIVMMVLGFLWYGPIFGAQWIKLMGFTPEQIEKARQKSMAKNYVLMGLGSLVMAYVLAHAIIFAGAYLNISGVAAGLEGAFWNWLGFVVPLSLGGVLWEGKSWKLFALNTGYYLVSLLAAGILLALWM